MLGYLDGQHSDQWRNVNGPIVQPNGVIDYPPFFHALPGAHFQESIRQPRPELLLESVNPVLPTRGIRNPGADVGLGDVRYDITYP